MDCITFGKTCRPYNALYKELFGVVPCPDDYACNREEFLEALIKAVESKTRIEQLIPLRAENTDPSRIY